MISFRGVRLARAGRSLIEGIDWQIHTGQKIGLTGANGCGKSSLFALLRGELGADAGDLDMPPRWRVGHVMQETLALPAAALEFVLDGDTELRAVEAELAAAEAAHDGERIGLAHDHLHTIDGYAARARAGTVLAGLGFSAADLARPVAEFSGGWRVRLNLARALVSRADLLLLDEPTNHLDLDAVLWLENWLRGFPGTLIVISHDREFLDGVVTQIAHIEQQRLRLYAGGYSDFERQRAERLAQQQATYARQQREIAHLRAFVDRFRAKATKARQAQSRLKALDRIEVVAAVQVDSPFHFEFAAPERTPDPALELEAVRAGYGSQVVLDGLKLALRPGSRLGVLGRNGAGKSTLMKLLAGDLAPLSGVRREGRGLAIGYFAQHQLEQLRPEESPLWHLTRLAPNVREQELRDFLGGFNFHGDMATAPCGPFSGGEKARLALALIVWGKPNLLLLDEPTNHLDLDMREALTLALNEYEGAVVLVSHDRHLLRATVDDLWLVADGRAQPFDGDLDDYRDWLARQRSEAAAPDAQQVADRAQRREERAQAQADRQARLAERRPLVKEIEKLERSLAGWQGEKALLDQRLADPALYQQPGGETLAALTRRQAELARQIDDAEVRWLEVQGRLEELGDID